MFTQHAKEILLTLQKDYPQINLEQLKKWGPLVQFQYDASGQNPIQRFVTLLVQMETENGSFVAKSMVFKTAMNGRRGPLSAKSPRLMRSSGCESTSLHSHDNFLFDVRV